MISLYDLKIIFALIIFILTILAGWYPFAKRMLSNEQHDFPKGGSLAAGIFLGAGLLHMLNDSQIEFSNLGFKYPISFLLAGGTFLTFLLFEHIGREFYHKKNTHLQAFAIIATIMLSIHSLLAGAALGLSSEYSVMLMIFFAIVAHKWAASFALAIYINTSSLKSSIGIILFAIFAIMAPIGILAGNYLTKSLYSQYLFTPIFSALAAGTFLYLGTLHGLERAVMVKQCCNLKNFIFVIIGFSIMAILAVWG